MLGLVGDANALPLAHFADFVLFVIIVPRNIIEDSLVSLTEDVVGISLYCLNLVHLEGLYTYSHSPTPYSKSWITNVLKCLICHLIKAIEITFGFKDVIACPNLLCLCNR